MLGTGSSTVAVRFPAHLGQQISAAIKTDSSVTVTGYLENTPEGESSFRIVSLVSSKITIADTPPNEPALLPAPAITTVNGKVADYQIDKQGRTNGLILTDQTLVKVSPHVADQLAGIAPKWSSISVEGYPHQLGDGQFRLQKRNIIDTSQLRIDGQAFLIR